MKKSTNEYQPAALDTQRLFALDGLRGLAALTVVLVHFTVRWSESVNGESLYPYGDGYAALWGPFPDLLVFGVNLFFVVSGFVIVRMLRHSTGIADFLLRRFARIWPLLFLGATATALIINFSGFPFRFDTTRNWEVTPFEYIASLLLIDPGVLGPMMGRPWASWVDGVYWTLWVDVRFYFVIVLVFWVFNDTRQFALAWVGVQFASLAVLLLSLFTPLQVPIAISLLLQPEFLAWFTVGIAGAYFIDDPKSRMGRLLAVSAAVTMLFTALATSLVIPGKTWLHIIVLYTIILTPFILIIVNSRLTVLFTNPVALTLGMASYALYIFHEAAGIVVMNMLADAGMPVSLILPVMLAAAVSTALILHHTVEKNARRVILEVGAPIIAGIQRKLPALQFHRKPPAVKATPAEASTPELA